MHKIVTDKLRIMEKEQLRLLDLLMAQRESGRHCCFYCNSNDLAFDGSFEDKGERYVVVTCAKCGLGQLNRRFTIEETKALEDENSYYAPVPEDQVKEAIKAHGFIVDLMNRFIGKPGRMFEVGCSHGYKLEAARRAGWTAQGIELSARSCRFAREVLDVPVFEGTLEAFVPNEPFDAIIAWHVLEHVPSLQSFLDHVHAFLAEGGHLFIQVPSYRQYRSLTPWEAFTEMYNPAHYWFFDPEALSALIVRHGFERAEITDDPNMRFLTIIARKVSRVPETSGSLSEPLASLE